MTDAAPAGKKAFPWTGVLFLAITSVGWGINWPAMKLLLRQLPPLFARGTAGTGAAIAFALIVLARGERLAVPWSVVPRLVCASFLNVFAWMGFSTLALRWLSVSQGALLVYTMPVWSVMLAWPLAKQRPSLRCLAGLLLALAGVWVLFGGRSSPLSGEQLLGAGLALAAAALFATGPLVLRGGFGMPPFAVLAWQLGLGCVPMLVLGLLFEQPRLANVTPLGWTLIVYMTIVPMGLCYLCWFAALRRLPPQLASITTLLTPIIGVLAAVPVLGEPFGMREGLALGLTLAGVALALWRTSSGP